MKIIKNIISITGIPTKVTALELIVDMLLKLF